MDEGKQPLTEAEAQAVEQEQQVQQAEQATGATAVPRTLQTEDPAVVDPRFDRDDLRQGKPPPAVRKHRRIHIRRKRGQKGTPLSQEERAKAHQTQQDPSLPSQADEGDLTDEEVDLTDNEADLDDNADDSKKPGFLQKVLGKS